MNETFNYLRANGIYNLEDLESRVNEHSSTTESLKKTLDGQTARMKEIKQLYDSSAAFQNLKPVYDGLQKIKFEKPRACLLYTSQGIAALAAQGGVATLTERSDATFSVKQFSSADGEVSSAGRTILPIGEYRSAPLEF